MQIKAALHFIERTFSSLCSRHNSLLTASTKLSSEIFTLWHSPYAILSSVGLVSEVRTCFYDKSIWKRRQNSRSLNLVYMSVRLLHTPDMHGRYQCAAQLSLSQAMAFFWLFMVVFSHGATPYVLNTWKLARNYPRQYVVQYCIQTSYSKWHLMPPVQLMYLIIFQFWQVPGVHYNEPTVYTAHPVSELHVCTSHLLTVYLSSVVLLSSRLHFNDRAF